jgi:Restriction endonuclease
VRGAGDQGVDIVVDPRGERVAVQCKNHSKPVGNRPVQEVYAGARYHRCAAAWVVAPAGYTSGALALAQSTGVSLYDANTIHRWIKKVDKLEKERASETRPMTSHPAPTNTPIDEELEKARKKAYWYPHTGTHTPTTRRSASLRPHAGRAGGSPAQRVQLYERTGGPEVSRPPRRPPGSSFHRSDGMFHARCRIQSSKNLPTPKVGEQGKRKGRT